MPAELESSRPAHVSGTPARPSLVTIVAVAIVAGALADLVHELMGHGLASWLVGDRILSLSSVALQNAQPNRFVSAAGTIANVVVGALSLLLLRRMKTLSASACCLWLFGAFGFCNSGYLVFSALLGSGDWAAVIAGLGPPLLWRIVLAVAGAALYALGMRWTARSIGVFVERGSLARWDVRRIVVAAYVASGVLMTAASLLNPIGPSLVLISGVGASFGLNFGLLFVPGMIPGTRDAEPVYGALGLSRLWLTLGLVVAIAYIAILGPGIRFPS